MRLFLVLAFVSLLYGRAFAIDTDGDGLLDLMDVPGFDPNQSGALSFVGQGIQDLAGLSLLTNATNLDLSNNEIANIDSGDFNGLCNLRGLHLQNNRILSIENKAFEGCDNLAELDLSNNPGLTRIESRTFAGFEQWAVLRLDHNSLSQIKRGDFDRYSAGILSLSNNQIREIEDGAFAQGWSFVAIWELGSGGLLIQNNELTRMNLAGAHFATCLRVLESAVSAHLATGLPF
ncbi:MAG: leucine-rich repeat domain-containing protein [Pirellulaceae bacterium]